MPLDKTHQISKLAAIFTDFYDAEIFQPYDKEKIEAFIEHLWNTAYSEGLSTGRLAGDLLVLEMRNRKESDK